MEILLSLGELRSAIKNRGMRALAVAAAGGLFFITAQTRGGDWIALATTRGQARAFTDPGKAILLLYKLGAQKILVDVSRWEPARAAAEGRRRPDVSGRLRRAHEVAKLGEG
jgi:hypothetical protein